MHVLVPLCIAPAQWKRPCDAVTAGITASALAFSWQAEGCNACRYYGLLAQRFCYIKREYQAVFEDCFRRQYSLIHRLETNKLRNVAKFFGHLLSTDAISWCGFASIQGPVMSQS